MIYFRSFCIYILATTVLSFLPCERVSSASSDSCEAIRSKYPFGSIYLTYIPVNDMITILNDPKKFNDLCSSFPPGKQNLTVFKTFLNAVREKSLSEAIAFLQLDPSNGRAGFKKLADKDGAIKHIPWTREQVEGIAIFCDNFLHRTVLFQSALKSIASGGVSVKEAWKGLQDAKKDPYIPTQGIVRMLEGFRSLMDKKHSEVEKLKLEDENTYNSIQEFKKGFDYSTKKFGAVLAAEDKAHLSPSASVNKELERWSEMEQKKDQEIIRTFENTLGGVSQPITIDRQPLRQLIERPATTRK